MAKMKVYDENVAVPIIRNSIKMTVPFCELVAGDIIDTGMFEGTVVRDDAHKSGDASYNGWLFYCAEGADFYPEDFGAKEK